MNLLEFSAKMRQRALNLPKKVNTIKKAKATVALKSLCQDTPVDTGKAVSNHVVTIGSPFVGVIDPHVPGVKGSTADANRAAAREAGRPVIASAKPGETIHITNNVPYLKFNDVGKGANAPTGITAMAKLAARNLTVSIPQDLIEPK